jgi:hypothetical protein
LNNATRCSHRARLEPTTFGRWSRRLPLPSLEQLSLILNTKANNRPARRKPDTTHQSSGAWSVGLSDWRSIHTSRISYSAFVSLMTKLSSHVPVSFFFCRLSIKRFKPFSSLKAIASRCSRSTSAICLSGLKRVQPGHRFSGGREGNIQEVQIFAQRPATVTFRDVSMDGIDGGNLLRGDSLQYKRKSTERCTGRCVISDRIVPDRELPIPSIYILPLHFCSIFQSSIFRSSTSLRPTAP